MRSMRVRPAAPSGTLSSSLEGALTDAPAGLQGLGRAEPLDRHDAHLTLLRLHQLHLGPPDPTSLWQNHPAVSALKWRLEDDLVRGLVEREVSSSWPVADDPAAEVRAIAALDLVPGIYDWLAETATPDEIRSFLAVEGGPDGGFDDLVALCQLGLSGEAKLELGRNYWDEMGRGQPTAVHTELHCRLRRALDLPVPDPEDLPDEALERALLGGVLATNRWLQPELVGALGLIELQAGPRCRRVVRALERVGAGPEALAFYQEHAATDPRHGKDWLDHVVRPLGKERDWAVGIVRGARWRSIVNHRFLEALSRDLAVVPAVR